MTSEFWSVVFGALIGAGSSIGAVWVQSRAQSKQDRLRLISDLAIEDHKHAFEVAKERGGPAALVPIVCYLHYYLDLLKIIDKRSIKPADLERLRKENKKILDTIAKLQEARDKEGGL